jgi:hypothetical protein
MSGSSLRRDFVPSSVRHLCARRPSSFLARTVGAADSRFSAESSWLLRRIALGAVGVLFILGPACLSSEELGSTDFSCPSEDGFRVVSQVIERRCGTLDCHGDPARSFRVYGRTGLRLPRTEEEYIADRMATSGGPASTADASASASASSGDPSGATGVGGGPYGDYVTGGTEPTSDAELAANRLSACGVEPDLMSEVVNTNADPGTLTLVRKPRLTEAHKGGRIWKEDSLQGDKCLTTWIAGAVDVAACNGELKRP